jgi:hypothetical protein
VQWAGYGPVSSWESRAAHRAARRALRESRFGFRESAELSQREELARTDREPHGLDFPLPACPIRLRSQPTTRPIASPSPYSTGTHGATCSRGRICYTHACSPARARAPAAPPSPRRRPGGSSQRLWTNSACLTARSGFSLRHWAARASVAASSPKSPPNQGGDFSSELRVRRARRRRGHINAR